tara:strand:- start:1759 stop:2022 length:264 start_codon:yes stop_codon:yes gene_type:complete
MVEWWSIFRRSIAHLSEMFFFAYLVDAIGIIPGLAEAIYDKDNQIPFILIGLTVSFVLDLLHFVTRPELPKFEEGSCEEEEEALAEE